jgi:hypothetical protein
MPIVVEWSIVRLAYGSADTDHPVVRGRHHQLAVRREYDGVDRIRMALEHAARRSRGRVPERPVAVDC